MNSLPRFCLLARHNVRFIYRENYARRRFVSARLFSSGLNTLPQTDHLNKEAVGKDLSVQSYDVKVTDFARLIGYRPEELPSLLTALTTKSFVDLFPSPETDFQYNGRLSLLGRSVMLMFIQEHLFTTYPDLPGDAFSDVSSALTNYEAMKDLCMHLDLADVIRTSVEISLDNPSQLVSKLLSDVVLSIVSALYCDQGPVAVKKFVGKFITSKLNQEELEEIAKLEHPKQMLCYILNNQGKPQPVSRLLQKIDHDKDKKLKHDPIFTVGVYSINKLLAEGTGPSLAVAENKAVKTALVENFSRDFQIAPLPYCQENFLNEEKIEIFEVDSTAETT